MPNVFEAIKNGVSRTKMQKGIDQESRAFENEMQKLDKITSENKNFIGVWRSREFLAQVFDEGEVIRISVNRSKIAKSGEMWQDGIKWDDLQRIKSELGYADKCAVELYPPEENVVNVANLRHLFVLKTPPKFMWKQ